MGTFYNYFFSCIWLAWIITWFVFAHNVKENVRRESPIPRLLNVALLIVAAALFWAPRLPVPVLMRRFLPGSQWQLWAGVGAILTLAGLLFTVWARIHLGRNWSGVITIKADHELITTGPYGLVRHPIYSGLELAFIGTALALGQWRGVLAAVLAFIAILHRVVVEDRWMRGEFGEAYDAYARRVRALVPGLL